jgi:hypothetical protein
MKVSVLPYAVVKAEGPRREVADLFALLADRDIPLVTLVMNVKTGAMMWACATVRRQPDEPAALREEPASYSI